MRLKLAGKCGADIVVDAVVEDIIPVVIVTNDINPAGCGLRFDLPGAIDLLVRGKVDTRPLISHQFSLDDVKEAFDTQLKVADAIKVLVHP